MTYDFDEVVSRRGTGSYKWDVGPDELPMWVADMDFRTAPEVAAAIEERAAHGIFGYSVVTDEWYDAYIGWWKNRHGFTMEKEWLIFCTGVVPAISSTVRKLTTPNERVVVQTPVYNIFFNSIVNNGCRAVECPLVYSGGRYDMDLDALEKELADPQTTLMILCNPHNPVGRIWSAKELAEVGRLCTKHGVTVISDEIHCDLTLPGCDYVPFASVSDECRACSVTCIAPTKAFNLAGMQSAAVCIPDRFLRARVNRALNTDEVAEPGAFAVPAAVAAFTEGGPWLDGLREYLAGNRRYACEFIDNEIPELTAVRGEATYLLWVDAERLGVTDTCPERAAGEEGLNASMYIADRIRKETGLYVCEGSEYGRAGNGFLRINLACPRSVLKDGMARLKAGVGAIRESMR